MKRLLPLLTAPLVVCVLSVSTVLAQAGGVRVTSPSANSTVGPTFQVTGSMPQGCTFFGVSLRNDDNRGGAVPNTAITYSGGTFRIAVDTARLMETEGQSGETQLRAGRVTLTILGTDSCAGEVNTPYTYQPDRAGSNQQPAAVPTATATLSPAASTPPQAAVVEAQSEKNPDPLWWIVIAFVVGGIIVGLAEYTAIRYHKTHKK